MDYRYILDTNIFIEGMKRYPIDVFPSLWEELEQLHEKGSVASIVPVRKEIIGGNKEDKTRKWVEALPDSWWLKCDTTEIQHKYAELSRFLYDPKGQFTEFFQGADRVRDFLDAADSWLVAFCWQTGRCLATEERLNRNTRKKLLIPVVCEPLSVACCTFLELLRALRMQI